MQLRTALVLGGIGASGCSLLYANDLDGAHSGEVANTDDGGGSTAASSGDSGRDGGAPSTAGEAGAEGGALDSGPAGNGDAATGCGSYHPSPQFCDDFDKDTLDVGWSVHNGAGNSVLDTAKSLSSPHSVKVTLNTAKVCQYSRIERTFKVGHALKRATFATRLNLEFPWRDGVIPFVASVHSQDGSRYCAALVYVYSDQNGHPEATSINMQSDTMPNHIIGLKGYPSDGEWSEIQMTVTPGAGGSGAHWKTIFRDPNGAEVTNDMDFPECPADFTEVGLFLGMHCETGQATASYDNARIDWE